MSEFPIVPKKTALLFFDTLNVYLRPEDPKERAEVNKSGIIPRLQKINRACREAGIPVFYAQADHRPDFKDFAPHVVERFYYDKPGNHRPHLTRPSPVMHAGEAREVIAEIAPQPEDYVIKKHRWSTFFQTHFELSLRTAGIDTIMLAGGSIEIGIASTAYCARDRDFNQIVLRDVCTSGFADVLDMYLDKIFPVFARVMTVDQAIGLIQR